jgi:uncharacterized membrane protein YfcA
VELIGLILAALIGVTLGLLGAGGSILMVPLMVYVLGFGAKPAIAMSLPIVGTTSAVGALSHWRSGNVRLRTAVPFGAVAMIGSYAGARLAVFVSGGIQLALLGIAMLGAAVAMFRGARRTGAEAAPQTPRSRSGLLILAATGLAIGALTGLIGIGGGFLIVPALVVLAGVPMKQAVGTSLVVITMNALSGSLGYLGQVNVPWAFLVRFTAVAVFGILVGSYLVRFVPQATLRRAFAIFLVVLGAFVLFQNRGALSGTDPASTGDGPARSTASPHDD